MKTLTVTLTFNDDQCEDCTAENYDPFPDLEEIMGFGLDYYNLADWWIEEVVDHEKEKSA